MKWDCKGLKYAHVLLVIKGHVHTESVKVFWQALVAVALVFF